MKTINRKIYLIIIPLILISNIEIKAQNLISNGSFEMTNTSLPSRSSWRIFSSQEFKELSINWFSPRNSSPDYLEESKKYHWTKYNVKLNGYRPIDGNKWIGITSYGCSREYGHCREYVQIELDQPLEIGELYYAEMWLSRLRNSVVIKDIGMLFSDTLDKRISMEFYEVQPQITSSKFIGEKAFKWEKISGNFRADKAYRYLTIGNLKSDEETELLSKHLKSQRYGYYFLDNISVVKIEEYKYKEGDTITINEINYETDKYELPQIKHKDLTNLIAYMKKNKGKRIKIIGHTDDKGTDEYNIELSLKRANGIKSYLISQGIKENLISIEGKGKSVPIVKNKDKISRRKNRRIEIEIQ